MVIAIIHSRSFEARTAASISFLSQRPSPHTANGDLPAVVFGQGARAPTFSYSFDRPAIAEAATRENIGVRLGSPK